jgi:hypothetical protein
MGEENDTKEEGRRERAGKEGKKECKKGTFHEKFESRFPKLL